MVHIDSLLHSVCSWQPGVAPLGTPLYSIGSCLTILSDCNDLHGWFIVSYFFHENVLTRVAFGVLLTLLTRMLALFVIQRSGTQALGAVAAIGNVNIGHAVGLSIGAWVVALFVLFLWAFQSLNANQTPPFVLATLRICVEVDTTIAWTQVASVRTVPRIHLPFVLLPLA